MDWNFVRETFRRDGIVTLNGVLATRAIESFRSQVVYELKAPKACAESQSTRQVDLADSTTWPQGSARRILEVVPSGSGEHWAALTSSPKLRGALDAILGVGAWELPLNAVSEGKCTGRYWYAPVVFPESVGLSDAVVASCEGRNTLERAKNVNLSILSSIDNSAWRQGSHTESDSLTAVDRSCSLQLARNSPHQVWCDEHHSTLKILNAIYGSEWRQVKRLAQTSKACKGQQVKARDTESFSCGQRLERTNGSHGGGQDCIKTKQFWSGKHKQCYNDRTTHMTMECLPPKCRISRSWEPVNRRRVRGKGWHVDIGPRFQTTWSRKLSGHFNQGVIILVFLSNSRKGVGGTAIIPGSHRWVAEKLASHELEGICHQELNSWAMSAVLESQRCDALNLNYRANTNEISRPQLGIIEQIVCEAGTAVLLHPWLIHSGTTNMGNAPRLMINGMACLKKHVFNDDCGAKALQDIDMTCSPFYSSHAMQVTLKGTIEIDNRCETILRSDVVHHANQHKVNRNRFFLNEHNLLQRMSSRSRLFDSDKDTMMSKSIVSCQSNDTTPSFPIVSIIIPVHNSLEWIQECLFSVLYQTYSGHIQVSLYDDASTDCSDVAIHAWTSLLQQFGISIVASGRCWENNQHGGLLFFDNIDDYCSCHAGGIGHGKNTATSQSTGMYLLFLDADDIMFPTRLEKQIELLVKNPGAILGGCWKRLPAGSTEQYELWANFLDTDKLWLEQFREVTVQMPTWCMHRSVYNALGGFVESPPGDGEVGHKQQLHSSLTERKKFP